MGRIHFYHAVVRDNGGDFDPLQDILASVKLVNNAGTEGATATVFAARTGGGAPADMLTDANGVIEFYLAPGDYNVHFADTEGSPRISPFVVGVSCVSGADGGIIASQLAGGITSDQLAGDIAAVKLAGGITNAQLAGGIASGKLAGGITVGQLAGGITEDKITSLPTTKLTGTITNAQLAGSIAAGKLAGSIPASLLTLDATTRSALQALLVPVVTSLPGSPADQDEVIWVPDQTALGATEIIRWRMKYFSSPNKWYYIGGSEARTAPFPRSDVSAAAAAGIDTNLEWTSGHRLTIPKAGDWHWRFTTSVRNGVSGTTVNCPTRCVIRGSGFEGPDSYQYLAAGPATGLTHIIDGIGTVGSDGLATWVSQEVDTASDVTQIWNEGATDSSRLFVKPVKVTP